MRSSQSPFELPTRNALEARFQCAFWMPLCGGTTPLRVEKQLDSEPSALFRVIRSPEIDVDATQAEQPGIDRPGSRSEKSQAETQCREEQMYPGIPEAREEESDFEKGSQNSGQRRPHACDDRQTENDSRPEC